MFADKTVGRIRLSLTLNGIALTATNEAQGLRHNRVDFRRRGLVDWRLDREARRHARHGLLVGRLRAVPVHLALLRIKRISSIWSDQLRLLLLPQILILRSCYATVVINVVVCCQIVVVIAEELRSGGEIRRAVLLVV